MRVLWFGTYSVGPGYPRNTALIGALRSVGVEVAECRVPLFEGPAQKIAAATTARGALRFGARAAAAWLRLAAGFLAAGPRDAVVVGYTGHLDLFLARALSTVCRRPLVLDAFLSPYDTIVGDRQLLRPGGAAAHLLYRFERTSLHVADLVLTDTRAGAEYLTRTFGLPRRRCLPVPVGSLVRRAVRARRSVPVGGPGERRRPFTVLFVGSFVPLQGVPYILDAAARAPDLRFRIVGDGPDGARIEEELRARRMANVGLVRRFVPPSELEIFLGEADAVLGVFGTGPKAGRVVPCKVYDGLAAGLPVVTGDT
ncbi:MAG: glycosyltransferase, partial [Planctomycetota bacterium]